MLGKRAEAGANNDFMLLTKLVGRGEFVKGRYINIQGCFISYHLILEGEDYE